MRLSATLRSSTISLLPVPLNSSKMTSSIRLPVSIRAVAIMESEPPSSILRAAPKKRFGRWRSEEHTSELQSLMRHSYAVFCLKKNNNHNKHHQQKTTYRKKNKKN